MGWRSAHLRSTALAAACSLGMLGAGLTTAAAHPVHAAAAAAAVTTAGGGTGTTPIYLDTRYSFQERAADLVSRMTLDEKVQQLHTNNAPAIPRLGLQQYTYWNEGQHGVNTLGADTDSGSASGGVHATSFPTNFAAAMTWDKQLMYRETQAISDEARGFLDKSLWGTGQNNLGPSADDYGSLTYWAPNVNLDRDPRWGRTDEAFGEDPYLVSQMAGAFVDGYQGQNPDGSRQTRYLKVAATAKHYALNNVEQNRTGISSQVTDTDLYDYYTAQFKSLIEKAHVSGLMTSYNAINGTPSVADTYTTDQIAQRTYGFQGYITSDCGAVGTTYRSFPSGHDWAPPGWTTDGKDANATWTETATGRKIPGAAGGQAYALRAGTDANCTGAEATPQNLEEAIQAGIISEGVIDTALVHLFTVRMETGEFDPASGNPYTRISKSVIESPAHQALATEVADNALVLLKNDRLAATGKPLLPADAAAQSKVVILGDQAGRTTLGDYSGDPTHQTDAVQGITAAVKAANPNADVVYDPAGTSTTATGGAVLSAQTQADVKDADLVVVAVGTDTSVATEGKDRSTLALPGNYADLVDQVAALGNPRTVLDIQSDGPVDIEGLKDKVPAIVFAGYNGQSQGTALADVLFGRQNPSGHLDFTWYKDDSQLPPMADYGLAPSATGGLGRTYQYFTGTPSYPFGYGLSYTSFRYSHVRADRSAVDANGSVDVSFDVTNTGGTAGATVAQLYAATPFAVRGAELPKERLEGFQKTRVLRPGETQHLTLRVNVPDLAFRDAAAARSVVYDGTYRFMVGPDSASPAGAAEVRVGGSLTPHVQYVTVQPESVVYQAGDTIDLTGSNRWIKDDTDPAQQPGRNMSVKADHVVEAVADDGSFLNLAHARVRYSSSDPAVATVSPKGIVTAVGNGAATIRATVDGVTGSAVVRVGHPLAVSGGGVDATGGAVTLTTTYTNSGPTALTGVQVSLTPPSGWTATATTPSTFGTLAPGAKGVTSWRLAPGSGSAGTGTYPVAASATYQGARSDDEASTRILVPYTSFAAARNNVAVADDSSPGSANLDGGHAGLSQQALAAAGITSGGTVSSGGLTYSWPTTGTGAADNVAALGQTIPLTGVPSGATRLGLLGTSAYGEGSGSGVITYTDGSSQQISLDFPDWWSNTPPPGGSILVSTPYLDQPAGKQTQQVSVYAETVSLEPGKTPAYLTLPDMGAPVAMNQVSLHIFAVATG
ncbi:glycoside hydrolase family 3 C-terminal domain-containing protein [Phaeacidiphilus oryzae]|uniref:glycoside hydrolase family 3 C-terminal domain-containing protein n=1 Tax=Phaeacidiphilus oryzae TaxID=348818 RepID=UPI00068CEB4D|nr:glycoside hydrolase family 3 C-terminal domain-containing protein [Phaeacidiphilus oryzae]